MQKIFCEICKIFDIVVIAKFLNMDKIKHCGVIKYLEKKWLTPTESHADMVDTLRDDAPGSSTVKKRIKERIDFIFLFSSVAMICARSACKILH